ncbi:unnamed protein product, partial [Chrysoparadoxa australica]
IKELTSTNPSSSWLDCCAADKEGSPPPEGQSRVERARTPTGVGQWWPGGDRNVPPLAGRRAGPCRGGGSSILRIQPLKKGSLVVDVQKRGWGPWVCVCTSKRNTIASV